MRRLKGHHVNNSISKIDIGINLRCIICNRLCKHIDDIHYDDVCYNCIDLQRSHEVPKSITVDLDKGGK